MNPNNLPGFDPHVQNQLAQLSLNQRGRASSQSSQASSSSMSHYTQYSTHVHPRPSNYPGSSRHRGSYRPQEPPGLDAFPPLGTAQPNNPSNVPVPFHQSIQDHQYQSSMSSNHSQSAAQEFFARARGSGRGRGNRNSANRTSSHATNEYVRPAAPPTQRLYHPNSNPHFANHEQQRMAHQRLIDQSDYLRAVADACTSNMLSRQEIEQKQRFSERLESLARQAVNTQTQHLADATEFRVRLQPYGSLANSFGTAGCDVDLLLTVEPENGLYIDISEDTKRDLEIALLDQGIGARLLTNTRIPILRVCERPSAELLQNLRDHRAKWEAGTEELGAPTKAENTSVPLPILSQSQDEQQAMAAIALDSEAADVPLPESPVPDHVKLEFVGDCGILCDINFTNHVALINSKLLWTYGQCDPRVRHMGIFVKNWAKARDINTPYRGTLSSYGYILMVLHYLINVAHPPLLPNLQKMARTNGWDETPPEIFEGHDIRFVRNLSQIRETMATMPPNRSSLGALLVGFFRYYGFPPGGFRWSDQVISIGTPGGILYKQIKGWTRAKWSEENPNVRQRYLLAIEDPFEVDHNIARTVGHHGLCAIRDEFRRAWTIIDNIRRVHTPQGLKWHWEQPDTSLSGDGLDLLSVMENRGDLLRKDADGRKEKAEKARLMRQELEKQEELTKKQELEVEKGEEAGRNGMWTEKEPRLDLRTNEVEDPTLLIHNLQHQDEKTSRMRSRKPIRTRLDDGENTDYDRDSLSPAWTEEPNVYENQIWNAELDVQRPDLVSSEQEMVVHDKFTNLTNYSSQATKPKQGLVHDDAEPTKYDSPSTRIDDSIDPSRNGNQHYDSEQKEFPYPRAPASYFLHNPDEVGEHIEWTKKSKAGLWLLQRDRWIRAGTFKAPTASDKGRLHAAFPYNPVMSRQQLADLNRKLETFYKDTLYPQKNLDLITQSPEMTNVELGHEMVVTSDNRTSVDFPSIVAGEGLKHEKSIRDWPVGEEIPWSGHTDAGRWLLWRDRKLKDGKWIGPGKRWDDLAGRLDSVFPHEAERTLANIERMNSELETFFRDIPFPRTDMERNLQSEYANTMHRAIDKVLSHRKPESAVTHPIFAEVYHNERKVRFSEALLDIPHKSDMEKDRNERVDSTSDVETTNQPSNIDPQSRTTWPNTNQVGRWLQWRDKMVEKQAWKPDTDSIFCQLDKLYPYSTEITKNERDRQNREVEEIFENVPLPGPGSFVSVEPALKAVLKVVEYRKNERESNRVKSLLNLFENQTLNGLNEARKSSIEQSKHESRESIDARSMQAVRTLSDQLTSRPADFEQSSNGEVENKDIEVVRQKRLAYFQDQGLKTTNRDSLMSTNAPIRRDSAAEGSWNCPSPQVLKSEPNSFEAFADLEQSIGSPFSPMDVGKLWYEEAKCDCIAAGDNADAVVPNSLEPDIWRTQHKHRFENPYIIPIVQTLDFEIDPQQLADINNIKAGGNGCVRGGQSPFMLESDQYSWGGGGAMAQKSNSTLWSWDERLPEEDDMQAMEDERAKSLMQELPGFIEL